MRRGRTAQFSTMLQRCDKRPSPEVGVEPEGAHPSKHPETSECVWWKLVKELQDRAKRREDRLVGGMVVEPKENEFRAPSDVQVHA